MVASPNTVPAIARKLITALREHVWLWFVPTIALTIISAAYAVVRPRQWQATQALLLRDEVGLEAPQGRFESVDNMKTAQETILEVARNKAVVEAALKSLGRPKRRSKRKPWPSLSDIETLQDQISVSAPKGAEFGRTEVIYLAALGDSPAEAVRRTEAVCSQLDFHLAKLRRSRAEGLIDELNNTVKLARRELEVAAAKLQKMEESVGPDLGELRRLNDAVGGEGNLQHTLNQIKQELLQAEGTRQANLKLRELLQVAQSDPDKFLATPTLLLDSQPALRKLREGLGGRSTATSTLRGSMKEMHPLAVVAARSEEQIRQNLRSELATALAAVETDLEVGESRAAALRKQQLEYQRRLDRLAGLRVRYSTFVESVRKKTEVLNRAEESLAGAEASKAAAREASLITKFDQPQVGDRPVGPGRTTIVAGGLGGGLAIGIGLVLLSVPISSHEGRRWSDYIGFGRRASDRGRRRDDSRSTDSPSPPPDDATSCSRRGHDKPGIPKTDRRYGTRRSEDRDGQGEVSQPEPDRRDHRSTAKAHRSGWLSRVG